MQMQLFISVKQSWDSMTYPDVYPPTISEETQNRYRATYGKLLVAAYLDHGKWRQEVKTSFSPRLDCGLHLSAYLSSGEVPPVVYVVLGFHLEYIVSYSSGSLSSGHRFRIALVGNKGDSAFRTREEAEEYIRKCFLELSSFHPQDERFWGPYGPLSFFSVVELPVVV